MTSSQANDRRLNFDLDPEAFRRLGYEVIDQIAELLAAERRDPVLKHIDGKALTELLDEPLPREGCPPEKAFEICRGALTEYGRRNGHPRFFAYVSASADPVGILADALASAMNQNVTSWRSAPAATTLERVVVRWLDELVGFDGGGHGLLVSGGSAANAAAIACAINEALISGLGETLRSRETVTLYLSAEGHLSLRKTARVLGVSEAHIRTVPVDETRRMSAARLDHAIGQDLGDGLVPACVCASAGTANTGIIDPLGEIADVCRRRGVWLHIDGAYGAPAAATREYRWMREALARANSLSLDPHKWLFAPLDVGCVLIRSEQASRRAFAESAAYMAVSQADPTESFAFFDHGLELSRRFRALKVWMILKTRGTEGIARVIEQNIALRRRLDERIAAEAALELIGSELSISCFRYVPAATSDQQSLNNLNRRILEQLADEGRVHMSPTTLEGCYCLRVCIVNFRTSEADIDLLVEEVLRIGALVAEG